MLSNFDITSARMRVHCEPVSNKARTDTLLPAYRSQAMLCGTLPVAPVAFMAATDWVGGPSVVSSEVVFWSDSGGLWLAA